MKPARKSGWTDECRAKQSAMMRARQIWTKSTGPKTAAGKARSAQNAYRRGNRAVHSRLMLEAVAAQNRCVRLADMLANIIRLRGYKNPPNELLARLGADFRKHDHIFHTRLYQAHAYERLCKNLAFSGANRQIVNANDN